MLFPLQVFLGHSQSSMSSVVGQVEIFNQTHLFRAGLSGKEEVNLVSICTSQTTGVTIGCHPFKGAGNDNWRQCSCQTCYVLTQHDPTCSRKPEDQAGLVLWKMNFSNMQMRGFAVSASQNQPLWESPQSSRPVNIVFAMKGRLLYRKYFSEKRKGFVSICPSQSVGVIQGPRGWWDGTEESAAVRHVLFWRNMIQHMAKFDFWKMQMREMLKTIAVTESKNEPLPPHASFLAASWFHLAGLCVKARFCELPSAKTVWFRCARVQIACPAKQIGYRRVLLHTSGSCRPKRARISQEKKLYLSFAQTKWCIPTAESSRPVNIVFAMKGRLLYRKHFSEKRKGLVSICPSQSVGVIQGPRGW